MFNKDIIIRMLDEKGWSRYRLCKEANMAQSTLSDILGGKNVSPKTDTLQRIANALEVPVSTFFNKDNTFDYLNKPNENTTNPRFKPIIDSLDRAGDLKDEDINEISAQVEFLINLKRKKRENK